MDGWAGTLEDWQAEIDDNRRRLLALGLHVGEVFDNQDVTCVLPGHHDRADVWLDDKRGHWTYSCQSLSRALGLAEVRAAMAYGNVDYRSGVECARWRERLDHEAGLLTARQVDVMVNDPSPPSVLTLAGGLSLFLGLRDLDENHFRYTDPFVFSREFAAAYCGLPAPTVKDAMRALKRAGAIIDTKERSGRAIKWRLAEPMSEAVAA